MNLSLIGKKFRQFPILFVCGILTPLVLVILFMRGPKAAQLETELSDLEREWQHIRTNVERSGGLEENMAALQSGVEDLQGRLMRVDDVAVNSEFFYNLEKETGVVFIRFSQGLATRGEGLNLGLEKLSHFSVIPYDITLSGSLEKILQFLDVLDRQTFVIRMEVLNLSKPQDRQGTITETLNARIRCHVLAEKHE